MLRRGLIVSFYFPPQGGGGVQRWAKFIKYLSRKNWQFHVIAAPLQSALPLDETLTDELPSGLKVQRLPDTHLALDSVRHSAEKIPRNYFMRWLNAMIHITDSRIYWREKIRPTLDSLLIREKFDVLIISIPPYSLAELASDLARSHKIPVLLDLRDPWTINPYKIYPTLLHRLIDQKRERKWIGNVGLISSAYQSTLDFYAQTVDGFKSKKTIHIPNGYDEEDFSGLNASASETDGIFRIGFSGSIYSHLNEPRLLFAALKILKDQGLKIEFHHFGTSVYNISRKAAAANLNDVYVDHGYLPHKIVLTELSSMNATCLILDQKYKNAGKTVGGKLYEYLRLKKPVIAIIPENGEAARIITETDSGIVCSSRDPEKIAVEIKKVYHRQVKFSFKAIEKFSREFLSEQLRVFLESNI